MAPRTRKHTKRAIKLVPDMDKLLRVECADMVFALKDTGLPIEAEGIVHEFFQKISELANDLVNSLEPTVDLKKVLDEYLETIPRPVHRLHATDYDYDETEHEDSLKNDTLLLLETSSIVAAKSLEEVFMDVDEGSNRTEDIFGVRSETLTSSEDDLDTTAISVATTQLEEMSLTEEFDVHTPLFTSTPVKSDDVISESNTMDSESSDAGIPVEMRDVVGRQHTNNSRKKEKKPVAGLQSDSMFSVNVSHKAVTSGSSHLSNRTNPCTPKQEHLGSIELHTPKKENRVSNSKIAHVNNLRSKFLMTRKEKLREENEKKAVESLKQKCTLEDQESQKKASSSRPGASLKRAEPSTPGCRPKKKTRVHLSYIEDKPIVPPAPAIEGLTKDYGHHANTRVTKDSKPYQITTERVYCRKVGNDYGIDDLRSDEGTDDENSPRKTVPKWAHLEKVKQNVRDQIEDPPFDIDEFFGTVDKPVLREIFGQNFHMKVVGSSSN